MFQECFTAQQSFFKKGSTGWKKPQNKSYYNVQSTSAVQQSALVDIVSANLGLSTQRNLWPFMTKGAST